MLFNKMTNFHKASILILEGFEIDKSKDLD